MKSALRPSSLAALLLPLLLGCRPPSEDGEFARAVIGPGGGTITSLDSVLTLAILPDALDNEVEFFIEATDEPPDVFGQAYLVRPSPELRIAATVTIRAPLPDDPSRAAVGAVDPEAFDVGRGDWQPLPVLEIDEEQQRVVGLDERISIFYALLDHAPSSRSATPPDEDTTGGDDESTGS